MKGLLKIASVIVIFIGVNAQAAMVTVNAYAEMSRGLSLPTTLIPIGTGVNADITFDIGPGTFSEADITNVFGEFTWTDDLLGEQSFNADNASISTSSFSGWFILDFDGSGPTIGGIRAETFSIQFNIGVNPFVPPGSSTELYDLILNSSIDRLRFGASQGRLTQFSDLESNVTGTVSPVPVPAALVFFISGLFAFFSVKPFFTRKR